MENLRENVSRIGKEYIIRMGIKASKQLVGMVSYELMKPTHETLK